MILRRTWTALTVLMMNVACDPLAPGASGTLALATGFERSVGQTLELRMLADDGDAFDPAVSDLRGEYSGREARWNVADIEFPFRYEIGGGLGNSEHRNWRVVAWISGTGASDRPAPGEWYGRRAFSADTCSFVPGYCGVIAGVDFVIAAAGTDDNGHPTGSGTATRVRLERTAGDYTLQCEDGASDTASSVGTYVIRVSGQAQVVAEVTGTRDGTIEDCGLADIVLDGAAEVFLSTRSSGSGGYADVYVYGFDGRSLDPIALPAPDPDLMHGYQGRDSYELDEGALARKFPVYRPGDANCCPTGETRTLRLDRSAARWTLDDR